MRSFVKTSISLRGETLPKAKKRAQQKGKELGVAFSFSAYIQSLIDRDLSNRANGEAAKN